jgi:hypothetical protein
MRSLSARELLDMWEVSARRPSAEGALRLLSAAYPDTSVETLLQLPIGQRDALLLTLREGLFGTQIVSVARCPQCGERLQLTFRTADLHTAVATESGALSLETGRYVIRYRVPNSADLVLLASCDSVEAGRRLLLDRCLLTVHCDGINQPIDILPDDVIAAVSRQMAQADPQADVQFDLSCPTCAHRWQVAFDVMTFLWNEIDRWARHVLREVHVLAAAYGWSEADILSLSAARRQMYLDLIGGT